MGQPAGETAPDEDSSSSIPASMPDTPGRARIGRSTRAFRGPRLTSRHEDGILLEANEIPRRLVEDHVARRPDGALATLVERSRNWVTNCEDELELTPGSAGPRSTGASRQPPRHPPPRPVARGRQQEVPARLAAAHRGRGRRRGVRLPALLPRPARRRGLRVTCRTTSPRRCTRTLRRCCPSSSSTWS